MVIWVSLKPQCLNKTCKIIMDLVTAGVPAFARQGPNLLAHPFGVLRRRRRGLQPRLPHSRSSAPELHTCEAEGVGVATEGLPHRRAHREREPHIGLSRGLHLSGHIRTAALSRSPGKRGTDRCGAHRPGIPLETTFTPVGPRSKRSIWYRRSAIDGI